MIFFRFPHPLALSRFSILPTIDVDTSLGSARVINVMERLATIRELPEVITIYNSPEFSGQHLDEWAFCTSYYNFYWLVY
jgi:hypothetical protein